MCSPTRTLLLRHQSRQRINTRLCRSRCGVEVDARETPLPGQLCSEERLVLNIINYRKEALVAGFRTSSFLKKNAHIMLVSYEHGSGRAAIDPADVVNYLENLRDILELWSFLKRKSFLRSFIKIISR
ncbi:MAG: hypothetical protein EXR59_01450 [Dehalococcoidia bacterium]|nr:hypothetical protein [Dehalococcoidia bacterium]